MEISEIKNLLVRIKDGYDPTYNEYISLKNILLNEYCYEITMIIIPPNFNIRSFYLVDIDCPNEKFLINTYDMDNIEGNTILIDILEKFLEIYES